MRHGGFLQISFQWLFAIIVGIVILFLAIYGVTRLIGTEERAQELETSKEIGVILNSLETGFEQAKTGIIEFGSDTRIYNICDDFGDFGKQEIDISQKSFGKWSERGGGVNFYNKYIFSKYPVEGKKTYVFSKPFEFPFKVTDLVYMVSSNDLYCFIDAPEDIQDEIENLNLENLKAEDCSESGYTNVCFKSSKECDIIVNYLNKYIEKGDGRVYFEQDALMYASIFSDKEVYECQVKRIMKRVASLAKLYQDKADLIICDTYLNPDLQLLITNSQGLKDSSDLFLINEIVKGIDTKNKNNAQCRLW